MSQAHYSSYNTEKTWRRISPLEGIIIFTIEFSDPIESYSSAVYRIINYYCPAVGGYDDRDVLTRWVRRPVDRWRVVRPSSKFPARRRRVGQLCTVKCALRVVTAVVRVYSIYSCCRSTRQLYNIQGDFFYHEYKYFLWHFFKLFVPLPYLSKQYWLSIFNDKFSNNSFL